MKKISYSKIQHKKKASTFFSMATGELFAAQELVAKNLYKESVIHLYFCSYYLALACISDTLKSDSHKFVETEFHRKFGKGSGAIPKSYVKLHSKLHSERNLYSYRATHTPKSSDIIRFLNQLIAFYACVDKVLQKVTTIDILRSLYEDNSDLIKDFSYDIYCPKTYSHHNRITYWQPPFYIDIFSHKKIIEVLKEALKKLHVKKVSDYVLGLNSRVSQYQNNHYLLLDIDSLDTDVESELKKIGGVLLKSGRGFHFIGTKIIKGHSAWLRILKKIQRSSSFKGKIDNKHIDISIARGYSTLRITESPVKPNIPIFYKEL